MRNFPRPPPTQPRTALKRPAPEQIAGPRAAAPQFVKPGGVFSDLVEVEIVAPKQGGTVRYTVDGSEPSLTSTEYSGPFAMRSTGVVKAKTFEDGVAPSVTAVQSYTQIDASLQNFSSNLPLIIINTFGQFVSKENPVLASLRVVPPAGSRSSIQGNSDYDGLCEIKLRGYSSLRLPKRSYTIKTRDGSDQSRKVSLLGMPEESDWVLYAPYSDKTLMRDVLAYELSNKMGRYAARTRFVEVFLSRPGAKLTRRDYLGVYVFEEKIKRDKNRVNIKKLKPEDDSEPAITGGYIIKRDHTNPPMDGQFGFFNGQNASWNEESGFTTSRGMHLFYVEPKDREITPAQKTYIARYVDRLERALASPSFRSPTEGYAKYLDVDSFIDQFWIVELSKNVDGFRYSCYMSKDREGKLRLEPIWDWNLSFGNANYHQGWMTERWYWLLLRDNEVSWFRRLRQDPEFVQRLIDRWTELRQTIFAPDAIGHRIDEMAAELAEAQERNFERWPILGQHVNPNYYVGESYQDEVAWMKRWIEERIAWIDSQFVSPPRVSSKKGSSVTLEVAHGSIFYTVDGSDPRTPGGSASPSAQEYTEALRLNPGSKLVARAKSGEIWSGPIRLGDQ